MAKLGTVLFTEDLRGYVNMLDKWLGGKIVDEAKNDAGELYYFMYYYEGALIGVIKPSDESTNTPTKVNGSTDSIIFLVDSKKQVDELYQKALDAGLKGVNEPVHANPDDETSMYRSGLQDSTLQYWSVVYAPTQ